MESISYRPSIITVKPKHGFFYSTNFLKKSKDNPKNNTRISTAATFSSRISTEQTEFTKNNGKKYRPNSSLKQIKNYSSMQISIEPHQMENQTSKTLKQRPSTAKNYTSLRPRPFTAISHQPIKTLLQKQIISSVKGLHEKKEIIIQRKFFRTMSPLKNLISLQQKIRIRLIRLKLNKAEHLIGYNFLKEILSENIDDAEKKNLYLCKIKENLQAFLSIKEFISNNENNVQNPLEFLQGLEMVLNNFKEGSFLHIYSLFIKARVYYCYEDFNQALIGLKTIETNTGKNYVFDEFRLLGFFYQGKNYQSLKNYKEALKCYLKTLQLSWKIKDKNQELLVYDYLGLIYYYLGDIEKAKIFHEKMALGKLEKDKEFKRYALNLYHQGVRNSLLLKKLEKTFRKAFISHINNSKIEVFFEEKQKVIDHELNIEMKKLEKEGKITKPLYGIGAFIYKNEGYFKKKLEFKIKRIEENKINEKKLMTHCSYNRNYENFAMIGYVHDKFQKVTYKSNKNNQKTVGKLLKKINIEINRGVYDLEDFESLLNKEFL